MSLSAADGAGREPERSTSMDPTRAVKLRRIQEIAGQLSPADLDLALDCLERLAESTEEQLLANLGRLAGIRVVAVEPGRSRLELPVRPTVMNPIGRLFGGTSFALADIGMVQAHKLLHQPGDRSTTLEMTINYLEPVDSGRLIADSQIIHDSDPIVTLESAIRHEDGRLIAVARGTRYISRAATRRGRIES